MQTPNARGAPGATPSSSSPPPGLVAGDILEVAGRATRCPPTRACSQTIGLFAEESSLTGESVPVGKDARAAVAVDAPLGDRATMLFVGTSVVRGKGSRRGHVATGPRTELGHLSALIHKPRDRDDAAPEEKLDSFGKRILWGCLGLSAILFAKGMLRGDRSWHELLLEAVSLAVAAIPEGLPAITTITLALGMQRADGQEQRFSSSASSRRSRPFGAATVICTDKTGTLTQNAMTVREVCVDRALYTVSGRRLRPEEGRAGRLGRRRRLAGSRARGAAPRSARDHRPVQQRDAPKHLGGEWRVQGDPTEGALP